MLCCSLGHVSIYKDIVQNGYKKTLILEDDVVPIVPNLKYFQEIIDELPGDWELFYLGYEKNEEFGWKQKLKQTIFKIFPLHAQLKLNRKMYFNYYPRNFTKHIAIAGFHDCTHAYALSLAGATKLLKAQTPVIYRADNLLSALILKGELNAFICKPVLFNQEIDFDSHEKSYIRSNFTS
jgi:glycosyl transferase family 25